MLNMPTSGAGITTNSLAARYTWMAERRLWRYQTQCHSRGFLHLPSWLLLSLWMDDGGWWMLLFSSDQLQHLLSSESCSFELSGFLLRLVMVVVRPFFGLGLVNADDYGQSDWVNSYLLLGPMHKITWCARFHGLVKTTESMSTYPISYSFSISFRLAAWDIIHLLPSSNQIS